MLRLADVVHVPQVAALLVAWLAPKDALSLIVWAVESGFDEVSRQWIALWGTASETFDRDEFWTLLLRCAAASGCRVALARLHRCGSIKNFMRNVDVSPVSVTQGKWLPGSVVYEAAKRGDLATLRWLCALASFEPHEAMAHAAANGHVEVARWVGCTDVARQKVEMRHVEVDERLVALAWTARDNDGRFLNFFATTASGLAPIQHASGDLYVGAVDFVAQEGDVALLAAMHENPEFDWSCTSSAMDAAASRGHTHVLEWLIENRLEGCTQAAMNDAARHGHLRVMQWLLDHESLATAITASTLVAALEGGQLDLLRWMHARVPDLWLLSPPLARYQLVEAACVPPNRLCVLRWLEETRGIRMATQATMSFVLSQGDAETAQWLADPTGDGELLAHWDWVVAKWMSYEFALWHGGTFAKAAENGHLHIIEWLAHAGPFHKVDVDTLWRCATRGRLDVVEFVLQRPEHQPKGLVFLPHRWSSFYDAVKDGVGRESTACEWDLLACDPTWSRHYVELWLLYKPTECKRVPWLPKWAEYCGHEQLAQRLKA